jgi:hypothetical protein
MVPDFIKMPTASEIRWRCENQGMGGIEAKDALIKERLVEYIDNKKFFSLSNNELEQILKYLILRGA